MGCAPKATTPVVAERMNSVLAGRCPCSVCSRRGARLRKIIPLRALLLLVGVICGAAGCPQAVQERGCASDLDCSADQRCDASRGLCLCIDDNACDAAEFCNLAGACQPKLECLNNGDCGGGTSMCDSTTGACVTLSASLQCVLDSQCPFGSFCEGQACRSGCREDGDCALGTPCIAGQCDATPGACSGNSFCEFGQLCNAQNRCVDHALRSTLCAECQSGDFLSDCPEDCLIDQSVAPDPCSTNADCDRGECLAVNCQSSADCAPGQTCDDIDFFFGIGTCSQKICQGGFCGGTGCDDVSNPCPRGYFCAVLQVVSNNQCTLGSGSSECGAPRNCNGGGENGAVGFCSCAQDSDCPAGANASCVNPGPFGSCVIGTTCAPADGLLCEDLR